MLNLIKRDFMVVSGDCGWMQSNAKKNIKTHSYDGDKSNNDADDNHEADDDDGV
jgi:hypothetical protein